MIQMQFFTKFYQPNLPTFGVHGHFSVIYFMMLNAFLLFILYLPSFYTKCTIYGVNELQLIWYYVALSTPKKVNQWKIPFHGYIILFFKMAANGLIAAAIRATVKS